MKFSRKIIELPINPSSPISGSKHNCKSDVIFTMKVTFAMLSLRYVIVGIPSSFAVAGMAGSNLLLVAWGKHETLK